MVSPTAKSSYAELKAKGLEPTFEDVVRMNAIGLRMEAENAKNQPNSTWYLPRIAKISESIAFRQPTIGHEIWFDKVARFCDRGDYSTALAIKAFALSRPASDLPDGDDPSAVKVAIETFAKECKDFTRDQIYAAICYAMFGCNPADGEASPKRRKDADGSVLSDWDECYALGVLNEGRAVLWGITGADMREMTPRQLSDVINRAYLFHQMSTKSSEADRLQGEFFATVDEIEARLVKESKNG